VLAMLLIVLLLMGAWLVSPAFRDWTECPKYRLLDRDQPLERATNAPLLPPDPVDRG